MPRDSTAEGVRREMARGRPSCRTAAALVREECWVRLLVFLQEVPALALLDESFRVQDLELDAPVLRHPLGRLVAGHGLTLPVSLRRELRLVDLREVRDQVVENGLSPLLRQIEIVLVGPARVRVAADLDPELRPLDQDLPDLIENRLRLRKDVPLRRLEVDVPDGDLPGVEELDLLLADLDRAAVAVDLRLRRRVGAEVEAVEDAVAVRVRRAARRIHLRQDGSVRALVDSIRNAVLVRVERAPGGVDHRALRRVGALVDPVEDAVGVLVARAALRVDRGAGRGVRALVDPVRDPVAIAVDRAAVDVHQGSPRRAGALVLLVPDAVAVGVGDSGLTEEGEL